MMQKMIKLRSFYFSNNKILSNFSLAIMGVFFLSFLSQVSVPLPFSPVPLTLQTLGIKFIGCFLAPKLSFISVALYIMSSCLGLPVLAGGGAAGVTIGYVIGFLPAVLIMGLVKRKQYQSKGSFLILSLLSSLIILVLGFLGLSFFLGFKQAFYLGFVPFIIPEFLKTGLFLSIYSIGCRYNIRGL